MTEERGKAVMTAKTLKKIKQNNTNNTSFLDAGC